MNAGQGKVEHVECDSNHSIMTQPCTRPTGEQQCPGFVDSKRAESFSGAKTQRTHPDCVPLAKLSEAVLVKRMASLRNTTRRVC